MRIVTRGALQSLPSWSLFHTWNQPLRMSWALRWSHRSGSAKVVGVAVLESQLEVALYTPVLAFYRRLLVWNERWMDLRNRCFRSLQELVRSSPDISVTSNTGDGCVSIRIQYSKHRNTRGTGICVRYGGVMLVVYRVQAYVQSNVHFMDTYNQIIALFLLVK